MTLLGRWLRKRKHRHPANAVSPYTGEALTWFGCGVHDNVALGSADATPHHCRGIWSDPQIRTCGDWTPVDTETAVRETQEAAR